MRKQIISFIPGTMIPAIVSIGTIVVFTRLLSPDQFGQYSYGLAALLIAQVSVFTAIGLAVMRYYPAALRAGTDARFLSTAYVGFLIVAAVGIALTLVLGLFAPTLAHVLTVLLPLLLVRGAIAINQAVNRIDSRTLKYNLVECVQAAGGFLAGLGLVVFVAPTATNVLLGMLIGSVITFVFDIRQFITPFLSGRADWTLLREMYRYAMPIALSYLVQTMLAYGDRFIVAALAGTHGLGIYAAAFSLVERPTTVISIAITTATFPMCVNALEHQGEDAARKQMAHNCALLVALIAPACLGIALTSGHVANIMVGPEFREGVTVLMPVIAAAALIRNIAAHFVDHCFHLSRRSDLMLLAYAPAAIANLALDVVLVPQHGVLGAAWAGLACTFGLLLWGGYLGSRTRMLAIPWGDMARIGGALLAMTVALALLAVPANWVGLVELVVVGAATYGAAALALNLAGSREMATGLAARLTRRRAMVGK